MDFCDYRYHRDPLRGRGEDQAPCGKEATNAKGTCRPEGLSKRCLRGAMPSPGSNDSTSGPPAAVRPPPHLSFRPEVSSRDSPPGNCSSIDAGHSARHKRTCRKFSTSPTQQRQATKCLSTPAHTTNQDNSYESTHDTIMTMDTHSAHVHVMITWYDH